MATDQPNGAQREAWNGGDGEHWTRYEEQYNRTIAGYSVRLFEAARIQPEERVVDIGCGCGSTTREAARAAARGSALGVDLSGPMIARARERAAEEGVGNVAFEVSDAQVHPFEPGAADHVISRFGVMFFDDPPAAFANFRRALAGGGRLTMVVWQGPDQNPFFREVGAAFAAGRDLPPPPPGAPSPFTLADPAGVERLLAGAGFVDTKLTPVHEAFVLGDDPDEAFEFVRTQGIARSMLDGVDDVTRAAALDGLRSVISRHDTGSGIVFDSACWIVQARAG